MRRCKRLLQGCPKADRHGKILAWVRASIGGLLDEGDLAIFPYSGLYGVVGGILMSKRRTNWKQLLRGVEEICLAALGLASKGSTKTASVA